MNNNTIEYLLRKMENNLDGQGSEDMSDVALYERLKREYDDDCECEMGG